MSEVRRQEIGRATLAGCDGVNAASRDFVASSEPGGPLGEYVHGELVEESFPCLRYAVRPYYCSGLTGAGRTKRPATARTLCCFSVRTVNASRSETSASARRSPCARLARCARIALARS